VNESLRQQAARGFLVVFSLKIAGTVVARVSQLILPLFLLPSDFGILALAFFFSGLLAMIADLGISADLVRRKDRLEEAFDTALVLRIVLAVILVGVSAVIGWAASLAYQDPRVALPVVILSLGLVFQALSMVPRVISTRNLDFIRATLPDSLGKFAAAALTIGLAVVGFAYWSGVYGAVIGAFVGMTLQIVSSAWRPRFRFRRDLAREIVGFGKFVTFAVLANFVAHSVDSLIVGAILGISPLGFYVVAYSWGVYFTSNLSSVLSPLTYPVLSRVSDDPSRLKRAFAENMRYFGYIAACLSTGVATFAPMFVRSFYGPEWAPVIDPMRILPVTGLLLGYAAIMADALTAVGRSRTVFIINWIEVGIVLVLLPLGTVYGGLIGASVATSIGASFVAISLARLCSRRIRMAYSDWFDVLSRPAIAAATALLVGTMWTILVPPSVWALLVGLTLFIGVYIGVLQTSTRGRFLADLRELLRLAVQ